MRCPKCHYLSFEPEPRCKNCGYSLSFGSGEMRIAPAEPSADDVLSDVVMRAPEPAAPIDLVVEPLSAAPVELPAPARPAAVSASDTVELPLFVKAAPEAEPVLAFKQAEPARAVEPQPDEPLVRMPRAPRPPLAVRRPTPAPGRVRERYQRDLLELPEPAAPPIQSFQPIIARVERPAPATEPAGAAMHEQAAGAALRIEAAAIDALVVGGINLAIIWLTLRLCDLTLGQVVLLPVLPIAAFLLLLDVGYLLMFTATNGQTIGKMAAGIRVIAGDAASVAEERVSFNQAILRAVLTVPSILVFGAGFLPALIGNHLALHDRFTHTRVVRA